MIISMHMCMENKYIIQHNAVVVHNLNKKSINCDRHIE